jgi:inner membrane protein
MRYPAHILGGIALSYGVASYLDIVSLNTFKEIGIYYATTAIGALLPDIDTPKSYLGRRFLPLSIIINFLFGHRGITHKPFFIILIAYGIFILLKPVYVLAFVTVLGLFLGMISHVILDKIGTLLGTH